MALTAVAFEQAVAGDGIVLVDFWAGWRGPCRRFAPVFEQASVQHPDVVFAKVDTEAALAGMLRISSIPTLMAFRDGVLVFSQPGALPAAAMEQVIAAAANPPTPLTADEFLAARTGGAVVLDARDALPQLYWHGLLRGRA